MKINSVGKITSFKAQMTSEVREGLLDLATSADKKTYCGRKVEKNVQTIMGVMPHVSLSIKKINCNGESGYAFCLSNPVTNREFTISSVVKEKKDLFTPYHVDNLKWAMYEENKSELNKYAIASLHSNKTGVQNDVKPYQDVFIYDGMFKAEDF